MQTFDLNRNGTLEKDEVDQVLEFFRDPEMAQQFSELGLDMEVRSARFHAANIADITHVVMSKR